MSKEVESHILQDYEIKKIKGSGAYGHVWKVIEKATGKEKALKKIFDAFQNDIDAQRTYRQISILHELSHPNIVKLHRVIKAKNNRDLYLVFDYMDTDLQCLVGYMIIITQPVSPRRCASEIYYLSDYESTQVFTFGTTHSSRFETF